MSSMEEKLWDYIDGNCTADEQQAISLLIETDEAYRATYLEMLEFNQEIAGIELDEPPMAFTYKVMETIRAEQAKQPLKAAINQYIIKGIGVFFVFTIAALLMVALSAVHFSASADTSHLNGFALPDITQYVTGPVAKGILFFDVILGLFLFDMYLRKRAFSK